MIYKIEQEIEKVLMGKKEQIRLILCAWLAGGHILLEDIPGVGKTTLAVAMCKTVGGTYQEYSLHRKFFLRILWGT
jgi:MoxR-like ATPase